MDFRTFIARAISTVLFLSACLPISANAQQVGISKTAAVAWTILHGIGDLCPSFPDEQARLDKLDRAALASGDDSVKQFVNVMERDPKRKARTEADVKQIVETVGGCDADALGERQAEGRQLIDTYTQMLNTPDGAIVVNWPAPALRGPVHMSVARRGHDAEGREYLKLMLQNPSKEAIGVALAGKGLRAGLCPDLTSEELPIAPQSYRATKFARLAPGESLQANVTLSADCFEDRDGAALMGTVILDTETGTEYRAFGVLGIQD